MDKFTKANIIHFFSFITNIVQLLLDAWCYVRRWDQDQKYSRLSALSLISHPRWWELKAESHVPVESSFLDFIFSGYCPTTFLKMGFHYNVIPIGFSKCVSSCSNSKLFTLESFLILNYAVRFYNSDSFFTFIYVPL